jgi:hypothetical protein
MDDGVFGMILVIFVVACIFMGGAYIGRLSVKSEAIDRGYMVQCMGVDGYHWECETDDS